MPWGEVDKNTIQEMVHYVRGVMNFWEGGKEIHPPGGTVILKRIKRYFQSHQAQVKASQERRRQRMLNRRNRLTMVSILKFHTSKFHIRSLNLTFIAIYIVEFVCLNYNRNNFVLNN